MGAFPPTPAHTTAAMTLLLAGCFQPAGRAAMWWHFDMAGQAHEAVIRGDLTGAQAAGVWLADARNPALPSGAEQLDAKLRTVAGQLAAARDIESAATATAQMAGTCGECHQSFGPGPSFSGRGLPPAGGPEAGREMRRHAWAAGRLWEGLVGPSDAAWVSGAAVLRDAWMMPEWIPGEADAALLVRAMETKVRELGAEALNPQDPEDREHTYAELISTCARCHSIVQRARG